MSVIYLGNIDVGIVWVIVRMTEVKAGEVQELAFASF